MDGLHHFSGWWFGTSNIFQRVGIPPASFVQPKNFYQSVGRTDGSEMQHLQLVADLDGTTADASSATRRDVDVSHHPPK